VAGASDLIATVPKRMAQKLAPTFGLQLLPFPVSVPRVVIYLIWPTVLARDPAHKWFKDLLEAHLASLDQ